MTMSLKGASICLNTVIFELINIRLLGFDPNKNLWYDIEKSLDFYLKTLWLGKDERSIFHLGVFSSVTF